MDEVIEINENNDNNVNKETHTTNGAVRISSEVVATIAKIAAEEVTGVAEMHSLFTDSIAERLSLKNQTKGVKTEITENGIKVDLYIDIMFGYRAHDVAVKVQKNVKSNIETMTGMNVISVNVNLEGVAFGEKPKEGKDSSEVEEIIID